MTTNFTIFDRRLLRMRQRRAHAQGPATFLLDRVVEEAIERLAVVRRRFEHAADIDTPTDELRAGLLGSGQIASFERGSITGDDNEIIVNEQSSPFAEGSLDLIVSGLALQFVNDLPGVFIQARRALKPDGLFLTAMVGGDSLTELRESFAQAESDVEGGMSPRVLPFADIRELGGLMQRAGFALPVIDSDRVVVRYDSPVALMRDLRAMGATNVLAERRRMPLRRATLRRLLEVYAERFADDDGRLRATFEIIWLSGWTPHESQPQPLRPGSAVRRLADALGTREIPTGQKPGET